MPYATSQDLETRYGQYELEQLAPTETPGTFDEDRVNAALSDAEAEINSYLGQRYRLPLETVPTAVKAACCDMARYYLYATQTTEEVTARYNQRVSWLRDIASKKASLGIAEAATTSTFAVATTKRSGDRVFNRDSLAGFTVSVSPTRY
jgi:phage gp36-like protein